ncbi:MAG: hypothetical protein ACKO63_19995 [Nodosilinea sp.]
MQRDLQALNKRRVPLVLELLLWGLALGGLAALVSCIQALEQNNQTPSSAPREQVYVAASLSTQAEQEATKTVLEQISAHDNSASLRVDYLIEDSTMIMYSSFPEQPAIWRLVGTLPSLLSTDKALMSTLHNAVSLCKQSPDRHVEMIVIAEGTSNNDMIHQMEESSKQLAQCQNFFISIVGIEPSNISTFRSGFSSIQDRVRYASNNEEIKTLLQRIN